MMVLVGCGPIFDPKGAFDAADSLTSVSDTDRASAALTRGDYPNAERFAMQALRRTPKDPNALLTAGMVYQATGRYDLARQYYEVIITNNMPATVMVPSEGGQVIPRSVIDVARMNLAAIDKITGRNVPRTMYDSGRPPGAPAVGAPALPSIVPVDAPRPTISSAPLTPIDGGTAAVSVATEPAGGEGNASARFRILKRLLSEGLITSDEYQRRRTANLGALLPYSQPPAAAGLDRPVPGEEAVVQRLRSLAQSVETREISPEQHLAERAAILEALLPAQPRSRAMSPPPISDMLAAGEQIGRLERLKSLGLVGEDEAQRERDAIQRGMNAQTGGYSNGLQPVSALPSAMPAAASAPSSSSPSPWAVALGSRKSAESARALAESIQKKFPVELGGLEVRGKPVAKGGKTVAWQAVVGPFADKDAVTKMCKTLKLHRQACDPTHMP